MADGEGICWREWLASRITTGRVIRGGFSLVGVAALGWDGVWTAARRGGWVGGWRGVARRGAVWRGSARERHTQWHSTKNVARERPPLENLHASRGRS